MEQVLKTLYLFCFLFAIQLFDKCKFSLFLRVSYMRIMKYIQVYIPIFSGRALCLFRRNPGNLIPSGESDTNIKGGDGRKLSHK